MVDFDVETTGLQPYSGRNEAFLWIFSDGETHEAIPFTPSKALIPGYSNDKDRENWSSTWFVNRERIQYWFNRAKKEGIRAWNTKFDRGFATMAGCFDLPPDGMWHDGMIVAHAVNENRSVALKNIAKELFGDEAADPQTKLKDWLNNENKLRAKVITEADKARVNKLRVTYYEATCFECEQKWQSHDELALGADCPTCGSADWSDKKRTRVATPEESAQAIALYDELFDPGTKSYERANYSHVPQEIMHPYALEDVILTRKVSDVYQRVLDANPDLAKLVEFERKTMDALFAVEKRGLPVKDGGVEYRKLEQEVVANMERLSDRVDELAMKADPIVYAKELAGKNWGPGKHWIIVDEGGQCVSYQGGVARLKDFNPNSTDQVLACLKARGADMSYMVKEEGKVSADAENLRAVDDELATAILDFRAEAKVLSTYVKPMIGRSYVSSMNVYKEPFVAPDSRIHATYRQVGARTGRMSCADPNMQNQPRDDLRLRYNIVADPGYSLVCCDLSNIEMLIFAAYCGEGRLLDAIRNGDDLHTLTAQMVGLRDRPRPGGGVETARQQGKVFNFTIIYGGGLRSIKRYFRVSQDQARLMKKRYLEAYPEVGRLTTRIQYNLEDFGYIQDKLISGRRYRLDPNLAYKGTNYIVQGTAASLLKWAVIRLHEDGIPMVALVHDEIVAHVPTPEAEAVAKQIEKRMTEFPGLQGVVPLRADADIVQRWSDAKPLTDKLSGKKYLFTPQWDGGAKRWVEA